jgi:GntR family transcriptional repressor for pyruvate dehydrogenase complex
MSEHFHSVQSEKLSELISRQVLKTIVAGHYRPGNRLPSERDLANVFKTSRVVVREALGSLAAKGILSVRHGSGTTVNPLEEWNSLDPEVLMMLHGDEVFQMLSQLRVIIEPELAALAAENIDSGALEDLRDKAKLPPDDSVEQHVERDTNFHLAIAKATGNPVLLIVLSSISELLRESRRRTFAVPGELSKARAWHRKVFEAIERRDPGAAREAMAQHMAQVVDALQHSAETKQEQVNS